MSDTLVGQLLNKFESINISKRSSGRLTKFIEALASKPEIGDFLGYVPVKRSFPKVTIAVFRKLMLAIRMENDTSGVIARALRIDSNNLPNAKSFRISSSGISFGSEPFTDIRSMRNSRELISMIDRLDSIDADDMESGKGSSTDRSSLINQLKSMGFSHHISDDDKDTHSFFMRIRDRKGMTVSNGFTIYPDNTWSSSGMDPNFSRQRGNSVKQLLSYANRVVAKMNKLK